MSMLENWRNTAYGKDMNSREGQMFWGNYFAVEKGIYEKILENPKEVVKGTVKELAEKFETDTFLMTGFLDGINDSLVTPNPIETMEEDTEVSLEFDMELLYKNMVDARADWLYELPQWDALLTEERRKALYKEQKKSGTIVKEKKIGRNDPCPCGSGKKYKFCCGKQFGVLFGKKGNTEWLEIEETMQITELHEEDAEGVVQVLEQFAVF